MWITDNSYKKKLFRDEKRIKIKRKISDRKKEQKQMTTDKERKW